MMNRKHVLSATTLFLGWAVCGVAQAHASAPTLSPESEAHPEPLVSAPLSAVAQVAAPNPLNAISVSNDPVSAPIDMSAQSPIVRHDSVSIPSLSPQAPVVTAVATEGNVQPASPIADATPTTDAAQAAADSADSESALEPEPEDPYEQTNRAVYALNDAVDKAAVKPLAKGYQKIIPKGPRLCASNIFSNLNEPYTAVNNLLQGKPKAMLQDIGRLLLNSTLGIGGCIDVASQWGIPKHQEDFGQTLAVWGVPSGPYVVLPVLGPSTVRDALSRPVDFLANPIGYVSHVPLRNSLQGYKMLDTRTNLLEVTDVVDQSALDPYVMTRDAWLQRRLAQIQDEDGGYTPADEKPRQIELAPRSAVIE